MEWRKVSDKTQQMKNLSLRGCCTVMWMQLMGSCVQVSVRQPPHCRAGCFGLVGRQREHDGSGKTSNVTGANRHCTGWIRIYCWLPADGKWTLRNILTAFSCALQAMPSVLAAMKNAGTLGASTAMSENSFSILWKTDSEHRHSMEGPPYPTCLWEGPSQQIQKRLCRKTHEEIPLPETLPLASWRLWAQVCFFTPPTHWCDTDRQRYVCGGCLWGWLHVWDLWQPALLWSSWFNINSLRNNMAKICN